MSSRSSIGNANMLASEFGLETGAARVTRVTKRGTERRAQILAAATEMFLERGFAGSDLDSIIRVTRGSKTNVYSQFGSKEGLFKAVVFDLIGGITEELHQRDLSRLELRAGLKRLGRDLLRLLMKPRHIAFLRLILAESARVADVAAAWHAIGPERMRSAIDRFLTAKRDEGAFVCADTRTAATLFHDMLVHSPLNQALLGRPYSPTKIRAHVQQVVETFLETHLPP